MSKKPYYVKTADSPTFWLMTNGRRTMIYRAEQVNRELRVEVVTAAELAMIPLVGEPPLGEDEVKEIEGEE